ncbi:BH3 interacting domain death agonist [Engraulis encrasicolus]|uniref:BH3 interacting domain death agonist n=1 Tax=Engraulis encrasicolus TaxID=184585 RepID=UPI002FCEA4F8
MSIMDATGDASMCTTPLVFLTFLQETGCRNQELKQELLDLETEWKCLQDVNSNGVPSAFTDEDDEGELQTDGHSPIPCLRALVQDRPQVRVPPPVVPLYDPAVRDVARELVHIADQLEDSVMARTTDNLLRSLQKTNYLQWGHHLSHAVDQVHGALQHSGSLDSLPQERVLLALSLSLIKGVCERTPSLLRDLFHIWREQHFR